MDIATLQSLGIKLTPEQVKAVEAYESLASFRRIVTDDLKETFANAIDEDKTEDAVKFIKELSANAETLSVLGKKINAKNYWSVAFKVQGLGRVMFRLTPDDGE